MWEDVRLARSEERSIATEIAPSTVDLLDRLMAPFLDLAGVRRTAALLGATVRGIVASERLICSRIAA